MPFVSSLYDCGIHNLTFLTVQETRDDDDDCYKETKMVSFVIISSGILGTELLFCCLSYYFTFLFFFSVFSGGYRILPEKVYFFQSTVYLKIAKFKPLLL